MRSFDMSSSMRRLCAHGAEKSNKVTIAPRIGSAKRFVARSPFVNLPDLLPRRRAKRCLRLYRNPISSSVRVVPSSVPFFVPCLSTASGGRGHVYPCIHRSEGLVRQEYPAWGHLRFWICGGRDLRYRIASGRHGRVQGGWQILWVHAITALQASAASTATSTVAIVTFNVDGEHLSLAPACVWHDHFDTRDYFFFVQGITRGSFFVPENEGVLTLLELPSSVVYPPLCVRK